MDALSSDARFAHIAKDPKFKRIPKSERKVKIDKRFQGMFKDKKFAVRYTVDKRGRPVSQTSLENLRKYYELSSSDEEEDDIEEDDEEENGMKKEAVTPKSKPKTKQEKAKKNKNKSRGLSYVNNNLDDKDEDDKDGDDIDEDEHSDSSDNDFSSNGELLRIKPQEYTEDSEKHTGSESDADSASNMDTLKIDLKESRKKLHIKKRNESNKLPDKIKEKLRDLSVNYARGEGVLMTDSSSSEDDDDNEEVSDEEEIEHNWGELDKEADTTDEITHRLAVCNMDWDRIRAVDLMVLFNSFLPSGGIIRSVTIYPSEFGLQRMKEEEITGPKELIEMNNEEDVDNKNEDEEGSTYHREKLRQYQLNRLKYYYGVVVFDSPETANKIYTECDGTEYESTATKLDLRFIPNEIEFDQTPKEVCDEVPDLSKYQPRQFTTTALQQVNVELTWDETNPERMEIAQKLNSGKLDDINERDLHAYLATDSSDDEAEDAEKKEELQENEDSDLETNADPIEKYKALLKEIEEKEEAKQKKEVELEFSWGLGTKEKAEKLVQEKMKKDENLTPFEQYLEKRKAKKKAKQEERKKRADIDKDASKNSEESDSEARESDEEITSRISRGKKKSMKNGDLSEDDDNEEKRKAELELLLMDEDQNDDKRHFNMKKIEELATMTKSKQKRLTKKKNGQQIQEDNFEVNVQDPRFNALFTSYHYNIDPADPHYRKTKGTEALIKEKLKRRADSDPIHESESKHQKTNPNTDLQVLVKTVKRNAKNIARPIK